MNQPNPLENYSPVLKHSEKYQRFLMATEGRKFLKGTEEFCLGKNWAEWIAVAQAKVPSVWPDDVKIEVLCEFMSVGMKSKVQFLKNRLGRPLSWNEFTTEMAKGSAGRLATRTGLKRIAKLCKKKMKTSVNGSTDTCQNTIGIWEKFQKKKS
jgi:hypothetical protein